MFKSQTKRSPFLKSWVFGSLPFWAGWALVKCSWSNLSFCVNLSPIRQHPLARSLYISAVSCLSFLFLVGRTPTPASDVSHSAYPRLEPPIHTEEDPQLRSKSWKILLKNAQSQKNPSSSCASGLKCLQLFLHSLLPNCHSYSNVSLCDVSLFFLLCSNFSHPSFPNTIPPLLSPPSSFSIITPLSHPYPSCWTNLQLAEWLEPQLPGEPSVLLQKKKWNEAGRGKA